MTHMIQTHNHPQPELPCEKIFTRVAERLEAGSSPGAVFDDLCTIITCSQHSPCTQGNLCEARVGQLIKLMPKD